MDLVTKNRLKRIPPIFKDKDTFISYVLEEKIERKLVMVILDQIYEWDIDVVKKIESKLALYWSIILENYNLPEDTIRACDGSMNWYYVWMYQAHISEDFIREFKHRLHNWLYLISHHHRTLSEDFIEDFIEEIGWDNICRYETLSEDFIEKHKEDILFDILVNNEYSYKNISLDVLIENADAIEGIERFKYLSDEDYALLKSVWKVKR